MSNFTCENCKKQIIDFESFGFITGCKHYPLKRITIIINNNEIICGYNPTNKPIDVIDINKGTLVSFIPDEFQEAVHTRSTRKESRHSSWPKKVIISNK
jgi:hypothetical protein